ncbi:hypothetical protein A5320_00010 [Rheinheimera sp. SA_1]|nr:hypothetical protein A5320_00010 [Rheinheimera sp. SA_1]
MLWHCPVGSSEQLENAASPWHHEQYQPILFDFNQDQTPDLLLHSKSDDAVSLLILGHQNSTEARFLPENSIQLPALLSGHAWSAAEAQLLPLRSKTNGMTGLLVIFPQQQAAQLFRFDGQNLDFSRPIAKFQKSQWPFLANVTEHELHVADFDNDGIDEILQLGKVSGEHQILKLLPNFSLSTQQKFQQKVAWGKQGQARIIVRDFDNNGFADIFALAKKPDSKHYLVLSDQSGKFINAKAQEITPEIGGLSWFNQSSGTMLVTRRDDQRANLLRLYNADEQSAASDKSCAGWLYDPLLKTSQEYCLAAASSGTGGNNTQQPHDPAAAKLDKPAQIAIIDFNECPIIEFSTGILPRTDLQPDNQCESMPLRPTTAPQLDASSYAVNQTFNVHLMNTRDPKALTYEVWATLNGYDFDEIATVIAPGANDVWPSITVTGRLSTIGHYQVRYRSCNYSGCSGFGPSSALHIYAAPVTFVVSANAGTGGSISPTSRSVVQGSTTSFTVTPNSGSSINSVIGCGGNRSGNTYTTAAINSACTVSASFVANPVYHTVTATAGSNGSISPTSRAVLQGSTTSFTVTPNSGFSINSVTGCSGNLSGNTYTTGAINSACTVSVTFVANPVYHTVTATAGSNGSISPASRSVVQGSTTSFTVTPNSGFRINSVTGCSGNLSGNTYTTGAINSACTVSVTFVANPVNHTVAASAGSNGSISPASRSVVQGSTTSFTVTPNSGFRINSVTGCSGNLSGNTYTTGAINSACTVSATFVANTVNHMVTATAGSNGSISPASRSVAQGSTTSFTVTPNNGFKINTVSGCSGSLSGNTFTTGVINSACTVSATFVANPVNHTVTATAGSNGSISPASRSVAQGSTTNFTVTPATGYQINSVTGCNGTLSGSTYNTGSINAACTVTASFKVSSSAVQVIYLHTDALGSVIAETDANGNVIKRSEYKPFGEVKDN